MSQKQRTIAITFAFIGLIVIVALIFRSQYDSIFRLSLNQVHEDLNTTKTSCTRIQDCTLQSGDILIRRYITDRTRFMDAIAHPYFTHAAFYLGDDTLVEAVGTEKDSNDDIATSSLSESDWMNTDIASWVILRPNYIPQQLESVRRNLAEIAEDPKYVFGLPQKGKKTTTCADLIFEQLAAAHVVTTTSHPDLITPDYLFWLTTKNPTDFEVVGFNVPKI